MSNETEKMPEKIWAGKVPIIINQTNDEALSVTDNVSTAMQLEYIEYTREDTIPDVAELQRQNAVLKTLFRKLFDEASWTVYDTIQNEAREAGAIIPHEVTQEDIDDVRFDSSECELGDTVFMMSDWMTDDAAKIPIPSRAQVAREFYDKVTYRADEFIEDNNEEPESATVVALELVLQEWEEADK